MQKLKTIDKRTIYQFFIKNSIYVFLILLISVIIVMDPSVVSVTSLSIIIGQSATRIIFALGVAGLLIMGGVDLSVGSLVGFAALLSASMLQSPDHFNVLFPNLNLPLLVPVLIAMVVTAFFSFGQGIAVAQFRVPPFISSLAASLIVYGICSIYYASVAGSAPVGGLRPEFTYLNREGIEIFGVRISYLFFIAVACAIVVWVIWNKTTLGRNMFAIGGNRNAARVSGVGVVRNMLTVYILAGLLYGLGGVFEGSRTGSASNLLGQGYELDAMAACVIGGVSMRGGVGTVRGVILGVFILQIINYGLVFVRISPDVQYVVKGAIILIAVLADTKKNAMID